MEVPEKEIEHQESYRYFAGVRDGRSGGFGTEQLATEHGGNIAGQASSVVSRSRQSESTDDLERRL